jgi:hypothetical protein
LGHAARDATPVNGTAEPSPLHVAADGSETNGATDEWFLALDTALAGVCSKLAVTSDTRRAPLFVDACELFTREYADTPWLIDGLITRGGTTVLGGEPKSIKTCATELAVAVATATPGFGEFQAQAGRVA